MQLKHHPDKVGRGDFVKLPPASIRIDPEHNIRDMRSERTRAHIDELKIAIRAFGGIKEPIEVRVVGDDAFVTDGECRLTAVLEMIRDESFECSGIACIMEAGGTDDEERLLNFGVSGTKERYTELELAEWCRRCERANIPHEKIAAAAGWKSKASVTQHLKMLSDMPEPVKEMVRKDEVSATTAMREVRTNGAEVATETLKEAKTIAASEGKKKVTRTTINKTKTGAARSHAAMPLPVGPNIQGAIDVCGELRKIAVLENVETKPDDEMVSIPAAVLKAARVAHTNSPPIAASAPPEHLPPAPQLEMPECSASDSQPPPHTITGLLYAPPNSNIIKQMMEALEPFARIGHDFDLNEKSDDDLCEVRFEHIKNAWMVFAKVAGSENV